MDVSRLLVLLSRYSLSSLCLSDYVRWLGDNPLIDVKHNDLISVLETEDLERLEKLEHLLSLARETVGLSEMKFKASFGFSNDLLTPDPDKVHNVLKENW